MAELNILNRRVTSLSQRTSEADGRPLGVCINDCEIDYGQPYTDLIHVCFSLGCAFAEMRWGKLGEQECRPPEPQVKYSVAS